MNARDNDNDQGFTAAERDWLEQELLELHFGCHEDPEALQARLDAEPALRALQQEVLRKAQVLEQAARPVQAPLALAEPPAVRGQGTVVRWYRRPVGRMTAVAAAVFLVVCGCLGMWGIDAFRLRSAEHACVQMTVSAPKAVPAGAPWSFTVQTSDLRNEPVACAVQWKAFAADGGLLAHQDAVKCEGSATIAMPASMQVPRTITVEAAGEGALRSVLELSSAQAAPLVHATTDKPVYRPGEPVFVRAVVLDRVTLSPLAALSPLSLRVIDPKGSPVAQQYGINANQDPKQGSVGAFVWQVPAESAGGEYHVEVGSHDGSFPPEQIGFVVRSYQPPRLQKDLVLDRKTYAPGQRGSAELKVERMAGGAAAAATVRVALVLDGAEVWTQDGALDEAGHAVFRFAVPQDVKEGSARFVARVTDGGVVETEVRPFVVPTGKVQVACFPEGGELIAGVRNRVYLEVTDPLGRPVDTEGAIVDGTGREVAAFRTEHQGRGRCEFTPIAGMEYRVRPAGAKEPGTFVLPPVKQTGIALRVAADDGIAAGQPARLRLAGGGDGPWLIGAFCRGVLLAQSTVQPGTDGRIDTEFALALPEEACGVLRLTVFDRHLQPVAERLVQRAAQRSVHIEVTPEHAVLAPGGKQRVAVSTRDEHGNAVSAVIGVAVTDRAAIAMGSEPRVGLLDQAMLFADVERGEDLGDFSAGGEHAARNVDLVLGTRGWRRFVWRNDAGAQQAIAAHGDWAKGLLAREGFSHTPQAKSSRSAGADLGALAYAARTSRIRTLDALGLGGLLLGLVLLGECLASAARRSGWRPVAQLSTSVVGCLAILFVITLLIPGRFVAMSAIVPARELFVADGAAAALPRAEMVVAAPAAALGMEPMMDDFAALQVRGEWKEDAVDHFMLVAAVKAAAEDKRGWLKDAGLGDAVDLFEGQGGNAMAGGGAARFMAWRAGRAPRDFGYRGFGEQVAAIREYAHAHKAEAGSDERKDFTETVYWNPLLVTDPTGNATFEFDVSDSVTTWRVQADAHATGTAAGRVGQAQAGFDSRLPFHLEAKLPVELTAGDHLQLPVAVTLEDGDGNEASVNIGCTGPLTLEGATAMQIKLNRGRGRALVAVTANGETGTAKLELHGIASRFQDRIAQEITVAPRGFPHGRSWGGTVAEGSPSRTTIPFPRELVPGSGRFVLKVFPSPLSALREGLDGMLQEPNGCFEQASSSNYPNTMVLGYVEATGDDLPAVVARARDLLPKGYQRIAGYECKQKGYEWFGGDPGHEALTAYGLLEFTDMRKVFAVDAAMVERTRAWLLSRRDGKGGFLRNDRALDSFGRAPQTVTDSYLVYALLYSGTPPAELAKELDALAARVAHSGDAYELAVIACALHEGKRDEAAAAARQRIVPMQQKDGSLRGATTSITSSGGDDLSVETTSFAVLAWLPDPALAGNVRRAIEYLQTKKSARGTFGATQATIMALKALTAYAEATRGMKAGGTLRVFVDDKLVATQPFTAGHPDALKFDLARFLKPGDNELRLDLEGGGSALPWACDLVYHADQPADDPDAKVGVDTRLGSKTVEEGRTVSLEVTVSNRTAEGLPMALAIVGLPAGLELPTRVLEDLQKAQAFDLWELRGRELVLYWRGLAPEANKKVTLDLVARIPGTSTGPASRSYLYYTPDQKRWAAPVQIEVTALR